LLARRRSFAIALAGALLALRVLGTASAQTGSYRPGQIFVGVGGGIIRVFVLWLIPPAQTAPRWL
jgi:hypothetical protein